VSEEDEEIYELTEVPKRGVLTRRVYSKRRYDKFTHKAKKYVIRVYEHEHEIIKNQAKDLNITIQKLIDFLLIDGFIKRDKRIIDFINEQIENDMKVQERGTASSENFTNLEINDIIDKIERNEKNNE